MYDFEAHFLINVFLIKKTLKTFVNDTKISAIPPLLENNKLITDFKLKANLFNDFFNQQCTTEDNPSSVPEHMSFETDLFIYLFIYSNFICRW